MRRALAFLVMAATAGLAVFACQEQASYVYAGRLYDPDAECLFPSASLDFVLGSPGDSGAGCDAQCITDIDGQVFLSATCPPLPVEFRRASEAGNCGHALAAAALCRECPLEGGPVRITCDTGAQ
jgi:hypothetical protein